MKKRICFRADASAQIGYGHFIRTLALADMLKDDFDCVFYTADPTPYQIEEMQKVCPFVSLSETSKLEDFLNYIDGSEIVVLDNYFYTTEYQQQIINKGSKLVCIDDMHDRHYFADIVINHAFAANKKDYSLEPYTQLCLGLNYALLRKPFLDEQKHNITRKSILICYGGLDVYNLTCKTLVALENYINSYQVEIIVGDGYKHKEELNELARKHNNYTVHFALDAQSMAATMRRADIAFLPASSVLWEAIFCGCRIIYGYYVDNQMDICRNVGSNSDMGLTYIGDLRKISQQDLQDAFKSLQQTNQRLTFIKPAVRNHFVSLLKSDITVREAQKEDALLYFQWANDPVVRQMAFHTEPISWESHIKWFETKIESSKSHLLLCYYKRQPVGQIRFDILENKAAEIDISIDKEYRGRGLGKLMLSAALDYEQLMMGVKTFVSEVKQENVSSNKMFMACKFRLVKQQNGINYYTFEL